MLLVPFLVVSKVFEKLVNDKLVDHLSKCYFWSDFQYGFKPWSNAEFLTVVPDRITGALNKSGATRAVALDISKAFNRVWHAVLHKLKFYGISGQAIDLILFFLISRQLWVILEGKQEYPVNTGIPQGSTHSTTFLLSINDFPDDVVCNTICAGDTTFYFKFDLISNLWQQLELASELESNLWDTTDWGKKWLVYFNAGKTRDVSVGYSNNSSAIDIKMNVFLF